MRKTVVQKFRNCDSLQEELNQFLAKWQKEHPRATVIGLSSHLARNTNTCSDTMEPNAFWAVYTFLYNEPEQDA